MPDITVSEWAEKYRMLPETANISGLWRNDQVPYMRAIMDAFTDPDVEEISVQASAQVGKTEVLNNMIGYTIHIDPCPLLIMQPTLDVAKKFSKEKLEPMIEDTKELRIRVAKKTTRNAESTTLHKRFPGGFLVMVGANSPHGLRQLSIAKVISDDIDSIERESSNTGRNAKIKEGDPVLRAEKRTKTFKGKRKKIRFSTPTIEGYSRIQRFVSRSNRQKYFVPCPHCGSKQLLIFKNLKWDKETDLFGKTIKHKPESVYYECESCKEKIYEKDKYWMIQETNGAEWRAARPEIKRHAGFDGLGELYSLFSTWQEVVEEFINCKDDREAMETFVNLTLGETFEPEEVYTKLPEVAELLARVEDYATINNPYIPNEVLILTCSVDTQIDRFEVAVKGWGLNRESWLIHYEQIFGDPDLKQTKTELDEFRQRIWIRKDGVKLGIAMTLIDSGGLRTQAVYEYCYYRRGEALYAIKGVAGMGKPLLYNKTVRKKYGISVELWLLGVDNGKSSIYSDLKRTKGEGVMHFSKQFCTESYFEGLISEKPVKKYTPSKGLQVIWEKKDKNKPNEPLDLENYGLAAIKLLMPDFERTKRNLDAVAQNIKENKIEIEKPAQPAGSKHKRRTIAKMRRSDNVF